jgi:formate hydrogenlyase subunit 6/NADH:ubiquinone oxidoreductase subunit I
VEFSRKHQNVFARTVAELVAKILRTRPVLRKKLCVGCGVCEGICPAKAIVIENGKAKIDRKKCIRCFCCQEFCPKSALKVERTAIARLFHRKRKADKDKK